MKEALENELIFIYLFSFLYFEDLKNIKLLL